MSGRFRPRAGSVIGWRMLARLHALLRSESLAYGTSAAAAAVLVALAFAWIGFLGLLILGLLTVTIVLRLAIEEDGPTGSGHTPGLHAASRRDPAWGDARPAAAAERAAMARLRRFAGRIGIGLIAVGGAGFVGFQLG